MNNKELTTQFKKALATKESLDSAISEAGGTPFNTPLEKMSLFEFLATISTNDIHFTYVGEQHKEQ